MSLYALNETQILLFFAVLVRVTCMFLLSPLFSHNALPPMAKILMSFTLCLVLFPSAQPYAHIAPQSLVTNMGIVMLVLREAMVGLVLGFILRLFFDAATFAFSFMAMQMGFSMASQFVPHTETNTPTVAQFVMILATLLMLVTDTHHMILQGLSQTFQIIPIGTGAASKALVGYMMETATQIFIIGVRVSAPMALIIFLVNLAFGIVAKAVPQINVLVVSISVNILAGFLVIFLTLPAFSGNMNDIFSEMLSRMLEVTRYMHG